MSPKCCKKCPKCAEDGKCTTNFYACTEWRRWFRKEWSKIRKAFGKEVPK